MPTRSPAWRPRRPSSWMKTSSQSAAHGQRRMCSRPMSGRARTATRPCGPRRTRMDDDALDDLVRPLTALVVKIDERDSHMVERLEALQTMLEEQCAFNQEQVRINT